MKTINKIMPRPIFLMCFPFMILFSFIFINGIWPHQNPLMQKEIIQDFKAKFFLESPDFPIRECADFYSHTTLNNNQQNNQKRMCDHWTKKFLQNLLHAGSIPHSTNLVDLRAPEFWQAVEVNTNEN